MTVERVDAAHLHPRGAATVRVDGVAVGTFGILHPEVADGFELPPGCLRWSWISPPCRLGRGPRYAAIPRFPASSRDIALVVPDGVAAGDVELAVREAAGALAEDVTLFDRFTGGAVPAGHASLGFRVIYRSVDRTLTDAEVDAQHAKVAETVHRRFGAQLRA